MKRSNVILGRPGTSEPIGEEATERKKERKKLTALARTDESKVKQIGEGGLERGRTILGHEKREQVLGEPEAELAQGALELRAVDGPRAVPVETSEYMLPVLLYFSFLFLFSALTRLIHTSMYRQRPEN